ncbi:MAG: sarcosine oxidase [Stappia sp.]|uniref:NAD(P)/FAD-dependent oxidoreductase n=1 Tax=Stappia sp. TaxID=1870903 RepID=UPI000C58FAF9|nr:FAD-dependent oxidoreductase [Stappia sp.]MAB00026.1 sarcosine oxidase [Stappia sp.]MBM22183.1 sarcosine oxidase [Stappia sp.]
MKVIIVGAGISGLSTAWSLAKAGAEVTLLEQGSAIPSPMSASGDQHRIIRRAYGGQTGYQRRIGEAYEAWDELWSDLGEKHLVDTGFLLVSQTGADQSIAFRDSLEAGGYPVERMSAEEAVARHPYLDPDTVHSAAFSPEGGVLLCRRIGSGIASWLRDAGAVVRDNARVVALDRDAASVRLETGEKLFADRLVVTAGAWVLKLLPELGGHLTGYRTAVAYLRPPEDLRAAWEASPVLLDTGGTVDGYVLPPVAGTGLKVGAGLHKVKSGDADARRVPEPGEGERLRGLFSPPFARIDEYAVEDVVTCAYTFTRDEHFFLEAGARSLVVSACSGHGYKFGAAVGRRVAQGVLSGDAAGLRQWLEARD